MGLWGNFKKILFEDDEDEELQEMPVYSDKEEVKEPPVETVVPEVQPVKEEPIKMDESLHFSNVKRDIDLSFDESDVLDDIINNKEIKKVEPVKQPVLETPPVVKPQEEKKSVFLSFDEDEFDRLNSRVNRNEARVRQDIRNNTTPNVEARKANNNFSSTSTSRDNRVDNDKYRISSTPKKSFTPSPIISPVYGILDKNYTKDDIVDKKDGLKREKIVKPVVEKKNIGMTIEDAEKELEKEVVEEVVVKPVVKEEVSVVDIDMVRRKAFGELEDLERTFPDLKLPNLEEVKVVEEEPATPIEIVEPVVDTSVEDELDTNFSVEDVEIDQEEKELDKVVEEVIERRAEKPKTKPQLLDDLEKTSTLQILDDIEKELNSIKPISRDVDVEEDDEVRPAKDDTLEKDLFNLIDSMYEEGEEEE